MQASFSGPGTQTPLDAVENPAVMGMSSMSAANARTRSSVVPIVPFALILALVVASCRTGSAAPSGSPPRDYAFALSSLEGLQALDAQGRVLGRIAEIPGNSAGIGGLRLSADRKQLVFALAVQSPEPRGFGSDIYTVGVDGSGLRPLLEHEAANVFYATPVLDPTGKVLYAHRREALVQNNQYQGVSDQILRVDLATGAKSVVVRDGADLDLAPDGSYLVYVHQTGGQGDGLWRVNVDGTGATPFFKTTDKWSYMQGPRFSPDGRSVVFCGAGRTTSRASYRGEAAHLSIPSNLVVAGVSGTRAQDTVTTNDDTFPAWSPDGRFIAYIVGGTFQVVDVASGAVREVARGDSFAFGELVWLRQ